MGYLLVYEQECDNFMVSGYYLMTTQEFNSYMKYVNEHANEKFEYFLTDHDSLEYDSLTEIWNDIEVTKIDDDLYQLMRDVMPKSLGYFPDEETISLWIEE